MGPVAESLLSFQKALLSKGKKISATEPAYKTGVHELPAKLKSVLAQHSPSKHWAFEGSVGKGSWSRTPWVAIYDERVTSRASDGFFVTLIFGENYENLFLVLMNTSSKHINYLPFKLQTDKVDSLEGFTKGQIPKKELSASGRGSGADFESSTLLWKKFAVTEEGLADFEKHLYKLTGYYNKLATSLESQLPTEKPFKENSFILR